MPSLAEIQHSLAHRLAAPSAARADARGDETTPAVSDSQALRRARLALVEKRSRAAARLLPRSRAVLAGHWRQRFAEHAGDYVPVGLLYHVDDAWAFGLALMADVDAAVRRAAHNDLVSLRLQWKRRPGAQALRIVERRSMLVAVTWGQERCLVVRMPGVDGRVWRMRLLGRSRDDR